MSVLRNSSATCAKGTAGSETFIRLTSPVMIMLIGFMAPSLRPFGAHYWISGRIALPQTAPCSPPIGRPTIPCERHENHSFCGRHRCRGNPANEMQSFPEGGVFPGGCRKPDEPQCAG